MVNRQNEGWASLTKLEHEDGATAKRVLLIGFDGSNYFKVKTNDQGELVISGAVTTNYEHREDFPFLDNDTGVFVLAVRNDDQNVLTDADGDYSPISVTSRGAVRVDLGGGSISVTGQVGVTPPTSSTGTVTNVSGSATSVTALAANGNRLGAAFFNDSAVVAYLKLGATASATSFTKKLQPDEYYPLPFNYTGIIDCIWASATGAMRVTELTP